MLEGASWLKEVNEFRKATSEHKWGCPNQQKSFRLSGRSSGPDVQSLRIEKSLTRVEKVPLTATPASLQHKSWEPYLNTFSLNAYAYDLWLRLTYDNMTHMTSLARHQLWDQKLVHRFPGRGWMWYNEMSHHVSACPVNSSCQANKRIPTFVKLKSKDSFEEVKETKPMQAWSFEHTPENCAKGNLMESAKLASCNSAGAWQQAAANGRWRCRWFALLFSAYVSVTSLVLALPASWMSTRLVLLYHYSRNCIAVLQFQPMRYLPYSYSYSLLSRGRHALFECLRVYSGYMTHARDLADFRLYSLFKGTISIMWFWAEHRLRQW